MRRTVVTCTATAAGVILLLSLKPHGSGTAANSLPVISSNTAGPGGSGASGTPSGTPSSTASGQAAAGSRVVTGSAVDTRYGPVQVRVTLTGDRLSQVDVVQYPSESNRDSEINSYALPQLNQEAIAAQSAQVDSVSGATYTSEGYQRSLQSALDQAGH
ncbi:FMN-binding protein [Kitasatospora sp. NPDC052896]|uniref:FMN-binding protein n=1 Tax=Kitasatospora sp. NPDC052896 TaxID=3364061 RepID=UPI0037C85B3A